MPDDAPRCPTAHPPAPGPSGPPTGARAESPPAEGASGAGGPADSAAGGSGPDGPAAPGGEPAPPAAPSSRRGWSPWRTRLLVVGIALAALNLRPAITSLGPLLQEVRDGLGMSGTAAGLLTSLPSLCFALVGAAAPRLARRGGPAPVLLAGMSAIAAGLLVRSLAGTTAAFLAASALALAGIALSNVLMPVAVKRWFPGRVGTMTGLYSMTLALGTSVAAASAVPVTQALGADWRAGLAVWAIPAMVAGLVWLPLVVTGSRAARGGGGTGPRAEAAGPPEPAPRTSPGPSSAESGREPDAPGRITRSRTAWALGCFFGLQATAAYVTMGWMPQIFRDAGLPASTAGVLLAVTMGLGVPLSFLLPRVAAGMRHQSGIAVVLGVCGLGGYAGLYAAPAAGAWFWALLLGISNCAFPLVLTLIGMRARTGAGVVRLSAFAQSTGYLISIPGPLLIGLLHQYSGGWGAPLALMAGLMVPQILLGARAGRDRHVEDETGGGSGAARTPVGG
ncbi:CynX/NimT family MFS transporter [Streptomyces zingiberis]|uniref:MFS transporter n=1 Tax=Streptomyces zingiberis TaxID=2053010 RepID=A0ABX1C2D7_9ACTN|nr:MFS transporter [Streptomyces zingiberis]NJQ02082.1 MFS transporter [Streptomyces zingiberis]